MIVRGRISIYGEYLMHSATRGLALSSRMSLASMDEGDVPRLAEYRPEADGVARLLMERGFAITPGLKGDLWQGCGLASSTAAARLYLAALGVPSPREHMIEVDRILHGFQPSGMDIECIMHQHDGLYGHRVWQNVAVASPPRALVMFEREGRMTLAEVMRRMQGAQSALVPLADELTMSVVRDGALPLDAMRRYAEALLVIGVYSSRVRSFVEWSLGEGIPSKGVGGLYDKAVLVLFPEAGSDSLRERLREEAIRRGAVRWADER